MSRNVGNRLPFYDAENPRRKQITTPHFLVWNKGIHIRCGTSLIYIRCGTSLLQKGHLILQWQLKLPSSFKIFCLLVALKWQITADYPTRMNTPIREAGPVLAYFRIVYTLYSCVDQEIQPTVKTNEYPSRYSRRPDHDLAPVQAFFRKIRLQYLF